MAKKADDTPSKIDWIWLREARDLAAVPFGSKPLALKRLCEWMAAGKLPWIAEEWQALDAAGIEKQDQHLRTWGVVVALSARTAYYNGDPRFWDADLTDLEINVENNMACEAHGRMNGARAEGIKVSRTHLLELLPEVPQEHVAAPEQIKPAERERMQPKEWLAKARKDHPRQRNEALSVYASRLLGLMREAPVTKIWGFSTLRRRLYDK